MPTPRAHLIEPNARGCYHIFSRCIRRAWLCGNDPLTGRSFDHRRQWIEDRIIFLAERFAVAVHAYAVMSNHYHLVIEVDPHAPTQWSDECVARRWLELFPARTRDLVDPEVVVRNLLADTERLALYRHRLGSLSWFMRLLNEPIARLANFEDACKGRFWESRFNSKALLDDAAWLAATAYVDLNPTRAGIVTEPSQAPHTSIHRRMQFGTTDDLPPVVSSIDRALRQQISLMSYCALLRQTAQLTMDRGAPSAAFVLPHGISANQWRSLVSSMKRRDRRVFGTIETLRLYALRIGQRWMRGLHQPQVSVEALSPG